MHYCFRNWYAVWLFGCGIQFCAFTILIFVVATIVAHLSWYNPALCDVRPINCLDPDNWWVMAAGSDARQWYNKALACPSEFPIGSTWIIKNSRNGLADGKYTCLDRGGMIVTKQDGSVVLDLLRDTPIWYEQISVNVVVPNPESKIR